MDARYTGIYQPTAAQLRAETVQYYKAQQDSVKRKQLANAYLAQQNMRANPKQEYRCERCGI